MDATDIVTGNEQAPNVLEEFRHVDVAFYDFENCDTRIDPIGPIHRQDVYAALVVAEGNLRLAASMIGRPRETLVRWLNANKDMYQIAQDIEESTLDDVETLVRQGAKAGDAAQQRFLLTTKGKNRGYTTRVENTGKDGAELNFARVAVVRISEEQMLRVAREVTERANVQNF